MILALLHINQGMLRCSTVRTKRFLADHKFSDFVTKKSYHIVRLVSKYPIKAVSDLVSVNLLVLFQLLITVGYRCA